VLHAPSGERTRLARTAQNRRAADQLARRPRRGDIGLNPSARSTIPWSVRHAGTPPGSARPSSRARRTTALPPRIGRARQDAPVQSLCFALLPQPTTRICTCRARRSEPLHQRAQSATCGSSGLVPASTPCRTTSTYSRKGARGRSSSTFNTLYQTGKQIVLSSDSPPRTSDAAERWCRARWGLVPDRLPCYETRMVIPARRPREGSRLPDDVARLLAEHIRQQHPRLEGPPPDALRAGRGRCRDDELARGSARPS
jgi:hypothetical protein